MKWSTPFYLRMLNAGWVINATLFALFFGIVFELRTHDFEFIVEPDSTFGVVTSWQAYLGSLRLDTLAPPSRVPYFDGIYLAYALASALLQGLTSLIPPLGAIFRSPESFTIGATFLLNASSYAIGCVIFYRTIHQVVGRQVLALACALALGMSPPMLDINLSRPDFLIMGPLMAVLHFSAAHARGDDRLSSALWLGLTLGLVAMMKLNGIVFALFPFAALGCRYLTSQARPFNDHYIGYAVGAFCAVVFVLMFRYWVYYPPTRAVEVLLESARELQGWTAVFEQPASYYFLELFRSQGDFFILTYLVSTAFVAVRAIAKREPGYVFFILATLAFSILALVVLRYPRGGYHLLPLFLGNIALTVDAILRSQLAPKLAVRAIATLFAASLVGTIVVSFQHYATLVAAAEQSDEGVDMLRRAPINWLHQHVEQGSVVCVYLNSDWAQPPLVGYQVSFDLFNFPYLSSAGMASFPPPALNVVEQQCHALLVNDFHRDHAHGLIERASPENAAAWLAFYAELRARHPPTVFRAPTPVSQVSEIELYDLE